MTLWYDFEYGSALIRHADAFACGAHAAVKQRRKHTNAPYIEHPRAVAEIVAQVSKNPEMIAAALLHDVLEDTGVTVDDLVQEFPLSVVELVEWLTDASKPSDGNRRQRKELDRQHLAKAPPEAQTIKLADIIHNWETIVEHDPDFARVYRHEKNDLLDVMTLGDPTLYARARALVLKDTEETSNG